MSGTKKEESSTEEVVQKLLSRLSKVSEYIQPQVKRVLLGARLSGESVMCCARWQLYIYRLSYFIQVN